ncbi:uncharacterized protein PAC_18779 [Phialocephala subalpina]|uniref:Uncharacterized protein n=1 Tax=Phialocephala subalpina TaxID=576137 RepID=A0A1L7XV46_9HELO|nr:uncharacterized protein PAC_18779 [Phialocephala subalpina]
MGGALPVAAKAEPPQYAQFEVGKNGLAVDPTPTLNEDALPPMPSWEGASKKHVLAEDEKNGVELGELDPTTGQHVPLMAGAVATGVSPIDSRGHSPFGARPGPGPNGTGYTGVTDDHFDQNQAAYNGNGRGYGGGSPGGIGGPQMGGAMLGGPPRLGTPQMRGSPGPGQMRGGMGGPGGYRTDSPQTYNSQGRGYGPQSPQDEYGQVDGFAAAPVGGRGYGRPPPQRQFSNDQYGDEQYASRPFPAQPSRQYSNDSQQPILARQYSDGPGYPQDNFQPNMPPPRGPSRGPGGPNRMASPPLQNNSGFDFVGGNQGYQSRPSPPLDPYNSRPSPPPQQMSYGSSRPSPPQGGRGNDGYFAAAPATRSPPPQEPTYPGYKPYQPNNQVGTPTGREPQRGWDPVQQ